MRRAREVIRQAATRKKLCIGLLFAAALTFRVTLVSLVHTDVVTNDGILYLRLAANLANGRGYTNGDREPYARHFFREPVYPVFLASVLGLYRLTGQPVELPISWREHQRLISPAVRPLTQAVKYAQAVVDSINVVLLFLILTLVIRAPPAFGIALLYAFYYPSAIGCTFLLREVVQTTVILGVTYCFARFLIGSEKVWIVATGALLGLAILTLQAMAALGAFVFLFLLVRLRSLRQAVAYAGLCALISAAVVGPWVFRTYQHYPDWRVIRSFGSGLTPEWSEYWAAVVTAKRRHLIPAREAERRLASILGAMNTGESLEKSFNGHYQAEARALKKSIAEPVFSKQRLRRAMRILTRDTFVNRVWFPRLWLPFGDDNPYYDVVPVRLSAPVALLSVIGICLWYRRLYVIAMPMTCFVSLFYLLLDENRRILPVAGLLFTFACLAFWSIHGRVFKKRTLEAQRRLLLRTEFSSPR